MNRLPGHITEVETSGTLSLVTIGLSDQLRVQAIVIETPDTAAYLRIGHPIQVLFKETEVILATGELPSISLQNRIPGTITAVERGKLISKIRLETTIGIIHSVISTRAVAELGLKEQSPVTALIKLNELMLSV